MKDSPLYKDWGVVATILTLLILILGAGALILIWRGAQEFALAWTAIMLGAVMKALDAYVQRRRDDSQKNGGS